MTVGVGVGVDVDDELSLQATAAASRTETKSVLAMAIETAKSVPKLCYRVRSGGTMKKAFRLLPLTLAACGMLAGSAAAQPADLKVGDPAPDFTLPATDGKTYTLSALKGHWVVLAWFPKAFTAG
jgi:AhpC/TSA family